MLKSRLRILMAQRNVKLAMADKPILDVTKLAAETGLAYTTVQRLYADTADRIDKKTLDVMTDYFDVPIGELFEKVPNTMEKKVASSTLVAIADDVYRRVEAR
jgi:DNA-binding Xre family transcriptional regulator